MVYVLDVNGQPLMPTCRHGKVKRLLKEGKAKVVKRCPFTIKLLYKGTIYKQNLTLGVDTGSGTIGTAVTDNKGNVVYASKGVVRNDISDKMSQRSSGGSSSSTVVGPIQQSDIKNSATFRITIPADLDRFQRWFMKFAVSSLDESDKDTDIIPLSDARLMITATNLRTGTTINLDVTGIMRKKYPCDWIGSRASTEEIQPISTHSRVEKICKSIILHLEKQQEAIDE